MSIWWAYDEHVHVRCPLDPYQLFHQSISIQIYIKIIQNPYHLLDRSWGSWSILWISGSAIACCTFKVEKSQKILNVPNISKCTTCSKMKSDGPWKPWKPAPHQRRLTASPWSLKGPSNKSCCSCKSKKRLKIGKPWTQLDNCLKTAVEWIQCKNLIFQYICSADAEVQNDLGVCMHVRDLEKQTVVAAVLEIMTQVCLLENREIYLSRLSNHNQP